MDTGLKNWTLTIGGVVAAALITAGYLPAIMAFIRDVVFYLIQPLGPLS